MLRTILTSIAVAAAATSADAQQWYAEEGQGLRSASIEYGSTVLSVTCVTTAAHTTDSIGVNFYRAGPEGMLTFAFANGPTLQVPFIDGRFTASTVPAATLYAQLIGLMKSSDAVTITDPAVNAQHTFSLRGSSQAIGPCPVAGAQPAPPPQPQQGNLILKAETYLAQLGFNPGNVDGIVDDLTHAAISAYQQSRGLPVTTGLDMAGFQALEREALTGNR